MSETEHTLKIVAKWEGKELDKGQADIAKAAAQQAKQSKKQAGDTVKGLKDQAKAAKVVDQFQGGRVVSAEIKLLKLKNKELRETNKLIKARIATERSVQQTAALARRKHAQTTFRGAFGNELFQEHKDGRNWKARMGSAAGKGIVGLSSLALGGVGMLASMIASSVGSDYSASNMYRRNMAGLAGLNKGAQFSAGGLTMENVDKIVDRMTEYGYSANETLQHTKEFSRATGNYTDTAPGMAIARQLGMDPSEVASMFGSIRQGQGGFGKGGMSEMKRILQGAVKGGVDASTLPEYLEGVKGFIQRSGAVTGGQVSGLPMAQILSFFEKSGIAGLKGARGAQIAEKFDAAIKAPGGGEEGKAFILNTLGFGRAGGLSYYDARKQQELGLQGSNGSALIKQMIDNADRINGSTEEANMYLDEVTGISLDYLEKIREAFKVGDQKKVDSLLKESTATELQHLASIDTNMQQLLAKSSVAAKREKEDIDRGDKYASALEKMADILNHLLDDFADPVATALNTVATGVENIDHSLRELGQTLNKWLGGAMGNTDTATTLDRQYATDQQIASARSAGILNAPDLTEDQVGQLANLVQTLGRDIDANEQRLTAGPATATEERALTSGNSYDVVALLAAIETLNRHLAASGQASPVPVDQHINSYTQMLAVLSAYQMTLPPSVRAVIDRTGGSP